MRDVIALLRCARVGLSLSHVTRFLRHGAADTTKAFDRTVAPLLEATVEDPKARLHARQAFVSASVKGGFLIHSYAQLIKRPYPAELAALGGSFTRLYDDLMDETDSARLAERMSHLFHGHPLDPLNDLERLLEALFHALQDRLDRPRDDRLYSALHSLHEWQVLSQRQRLPGISIDSLTRITANKGGFANVALFALVRQEMTPEEFKLLMELGTIFQLMDDYMDVATDRAKAINTLITCGEITMAELADRLRRLAPGIKDFYGPNANPFLSVVYILLVAAFLKQRRTPTLHLPRAIRGRIRGPLGILLFHGGSAVPTQL